MSARKEEGAERGPVLTLALSIYLPSLLFSVGSYALLPMLPLIATGQNAEPWVAGIITTAVFFGVLCGDLPSGILTAKFGERQIMVAAAAVSTLSMVAALFLPSLIVLAAAAFINGVAQAAFALARMSFLTHYTPLRYRARAMSTLGGTFRVGAALGPLLVAVVSAATGDIRYALILPLLFSAGAGIISLLLSDPAKHMGGRRQSTPRRAAGVAEMVEVFRRKKKGLLQIGLPAAVLQVMRNTRSVIMPLLGVSLGMSDALVALIIGVAAAAEMLLFYFSGIIMDRLGRIWAIAPSLILLALSYGGVFLVQSTSMFIVINMLMALGNALSSGAVVTLGADLSDSANPAPFISLWLFFTDTGLGAGTTLASFLIGVIGLAGSSLTVGGLGIVGALMIVRYLPRYRPSGSTGVLPVVGPGKPR